MTQRLALCVCYGGGHVAMVKPVALALQDKGWSVQVLALTTAFNALEGTGLSCLQFQDLIPFASDVEKSIALGKELVGEHSPTAPVSYDESVAYHGISLLDLMDRIGESEARVLYDNIQRKAFFPVDVMQRFLASLAPDVVIATNVPRTEKAAITAAGLLGIPAVCMVDLFAGDVEWIGRPGYADRICVLSEQVRQAYLDAGRMPEEVVTTGNPAFDNLNVMAPIAETNRAKRRKNESYTIFWASQPEPECHPMTGAPANPRLPMEVEAVLAQALEDRIHWNLIIRLHPSEQRKIEVSGDRIRFSPRDEDLHEVLADCDVLVTMTSTVALEANLLGLPVITVDLSAYSPEMPLSRMDVSTGVSSLADLVPTIEDALANGDSTYEPFEPATPKIIAEIESIVTDGDAPLRDSRT